MIAAIGYHHLKRGERDSLDQDVYSRKPTPLAISGKPLKTRPQYPLTA
jgi:hypothetical protein